MALKLFLPNAENAFVANKKITNYLLDSSNPQNKGKSTFFANIGYSVSNIEILRADLQSIAQNGTVKEVISNNEGKKYVIVGSILAPNGRNYVLKTVWIVEFLYNCPRLITAYPN